jgi:FKBP-type peptidyl-prolyl cis-trans isomerase
MSIKRLINNSWAVAVSAILLVAACEDEVRIRSQEDKLAYTIGYSMGKNIQITLEQRGDSPSQEHMLAGIRAAMQGSSLVMTDEEMLGILTEHRKASEEKGKQAAEAAAEEALKAGAAYLDENGQRQGVNALPSGLQYKVLAAGDGPRASMQDTVRAHYVGRFITGEEFEGTYSQGQPVDFPLQHVIPGWQEALQLMPSGSKWEVSVPSELAYGKRGTPNIPPNSTLVFDIELLGILGKTIGGK